MRGHRAVADEAVEEGVRLFGGDGIGAGQRQVDDLCVLSDRHARHTDTARTRTDDEVAAILLDQLLQPADADIGGRFRIDHGQFDRPPSDPALLVDRRDGRLGRPHLPQAVMRQRTGQVCLHTQPDRVIGGGGAAQPGRRQGHPGQHGATGELGSRNHDGILHGWGDEDRIASG